MLTKLPRLRKVKPSLRLIKHHAVQTYGGVKYRYTYSQSRHLDGGEWSASHSGRFTSREGALNRWLG